jgi:type 1 glutamine amidotransferase
MTEIDPASILLLAKGHPYAREAFYDIFDTMPGVDWTLVEQPAAAHLCTPELAAPYDALVLYDMPGIFFDGEIVPEIISPSPQIKSNFMKMVEAGHGLVFLHHAIAGWQDWDDYARLMGGRFLYRPRRVMDHDYTDSGYRHEVRHTVSVVTDHPVTQGLPQQFDIEDEVYLYEVFDDDKTPLLQSHHDFSWQNFYSAAAACDGRLNDNTGWTHRRGSSLVCWAREIGPTRLVYIQFGDGPSAYSNPHYRRLIANAIDWVRKDQR